MRKEPKRMSINWLGASVKIFKASILVELAFVGISYYVWSKMNTSRDFRFKMYNNYPFILKGYYWSGETFGGLQIKQADYESWGIKDGS